MIDFPDARKIADMLAAIGEPTRMLILHRLVQGTYNVGELAELVGIPMVNMSHHLGVMRQAGLLGRVKEGRRVLYSLNRDVFIPANGNSGETAGTLQIGTLRVVLAPDPSPPPTPAKKKGEKK